MTTRKLVLSFFHILPYILMPFPFTPLYSILSIKYNPNVIYLKCTKSTKAEKKNLLLLGSNILLSKISSQYLSLFNIIICLYVLVLKSLQVLYGINPSTVNSVSAGVQEKS